MDFYPYGLLFEMADEAVEIAEAKPRKLEKVSKENKVPGILGLNDSASILYYLEKSERLLEKYRMEVKTPFSWVHAAL